MTASQTPDNALRTSSNGLFLNEDCNHFMHSRTAEEMTPEGVDGLVDVYANGTQVTDLVFNPNAMRSSVASKVKQPFWEGFDPTADNDQPFFAGTADNRDLIRKWVDNMRLLDERGIDPYARWLTRSREYGVRGWISVRMNDIHCVDEPGHTMHDRFWQEHPQFWRTTWREYESPADRCLDYHHEAVRTHHLEYTRECVERWDMDGIELDWMRQPWCLRPGREGQGARLLTEFTAQVRDMVNQRAKALGHPIKLSARVPSRPDVALRMGFDTVAWAREGLVDLIIPTPAFGNTDYDMPVEIWRALLQGTDAELAPGLEISTVAAPFGDFVYNNLQQVRGAAASLFDRGGPYLYLFNYMDRDPTCTTVTRLDQVIRETGSPETLRGKARSHVYTFPNLWAPGEIPAFNLPYRLSRYGYRPSAEFRIPIGPAPDASQSATVVLGLQKGDAPESEGRVVAAYGRKIHHDLPPAAPESARQVQVHVNGETVEYAGGIEGAPDRHEFSIPQGVLNRGDNVIELYNPTETTLTVVWCEIAIDGAGN